MCFSGSSSPLSNSVLSISCWNIHGFSDHFRFGNKLKNQEFLDYFKNYEIVILTKSWMKDNVLLPGFKTFSNSAQKFHKKKSGRLSGGLVLGYKNHLENSISFIKSCTNYIWCKLNHTFFNLENDIYLCALYIPPQTLCISIPIFLLTKKQISHSFATKALLC